MNPTKTVRALLALSLVANAALGWMLWQERQQQQHPEQTASVEANSTSASSPDTPPPPKPAPLVSPSTTLTKESLPLASQTTPTPTPPPATVPTPEVESAIPRAPRIEPPLPPPTRAGSLTTKADTLLFSKPETRAAVDPNSLPAYLRLEQPERKAYGPPPPPNPHAVPPWHERLPYRENQMKRGLYLTPFKLDK